MGCANQVACVSFVIGIVNHNINPVPSCPNRGHELVFIPFLFWEINQRFGLWCPIRFIHISHLDVIISSQNLHTYQDRLVCIIWHWLQYLHPDSGSEVKTGVEIN